MKNSHSNVAIFWKKVILHANNMVNISIFWHDYHRISTKKSIQLKWKLSKIHKYQIDDFVKKCLARTIIGILEETNNFLQNVLSWPYEQHK